MKYIPIERIQQAIEHLEHFRSKWVLVPLVFAANGVSEAEEVNITAEEQAGAEKFLNQYFNGSLIGLPAFERGVNTLRPRFKELTRTKGKEDDYVFHQRQGLWANAYSSRGYREMREGRLISGAGGSSRFQLNESFWDAWEEELPDTFHFEELLVWLYAFHGVPDSINSWRELFADFQEKHLGRGNRFPFGYDIRFGVDNNVPWIGNFLTVKPTNEEYQRALIPSRFNPQPETNVADASKLEDDDPIFVRVRQLLKDRFAGVILSGLKLVGTVNNFNFYQYIFDLSNENPEEEEANFAKEMLSLINITANNASSGAVSK